MPRVVTLLFRILFHTFPLNFPYYFHIAFELQTPKLDMVPNCSLTTVVHMSNIKSSYLLAITLFYISGLHCPFSHRITVRFHFEVLIQKESKIFFNVLVFQKEPLPCTASCLHALLHCLVLT